MSEEIEHTRLLCAGSMLDKVVKMSVAGRAEPNFPVLSSMVSVLVSLGSAAQHHFTLSRFSTGR